MDSERLVRDSAAVTAMLNRLLHHGRVLKCGPTQLANLNGLAGTGGKEVKSWS